MKDLAPRHEMHHHRHHRHHHHRHHQVSAALVIGELEVTIRDTGPVSLSACPPACLSACLLVSLSACLPVPLSACLLACLPACLLACLPSCPAVSVGIITGHLEIIFVTPVLHAVTSFFLPINKESPLGIYLACNNYENAQKYTR
jgi:hypothetical protein